jgi:microcin C transport system substrate-binding protein
MTAPARRRAPAPALAILLGAALFAGPAALAQEAGGEVTVSHGYTYFGNLRYAPDFAQLDYVNPDAPKGGEMAIWAQGTFDSFNNFTIQGNSAALATIGQETILTGTADDPTDAYCYLCTTLEYPADLSWVIFNLRPEARFSDGTPLTAEDVAFSHALFMEQGLESFRAAFGSFIESVEVLDPHRVRFTFTPDSPPRDRIGLAGRRSAPVPTSSRAST